MGSIGSRLRALRAKNKVKEEQESKKPVVLETATARKTLTKKEALQVFGHESFRPGQEEVIDAILAGGEGVLCVLPTGGGKSLTFQLPAIMSDKTTIVVSPLIALMKDQVDSLTNLGISAAVINSTQSRFDREEVIRNLNAGKVKLLYVSPERFDNREFLLLLDTLNIGLFAVDECHCISTWGNDFRPAYLKLKDAIKRIKPHQVVALTATATARVRDDICESLGIPNAQRFVRGVYRGNLDICCINDSGIKRERMIMSLVEEYGSDCTGIIYAATKKEADATGMYLRENGVPTASVYHAGFSDKKRKEIQETWANNGGIVVATCAFGMGIDQADVRFIIYSGFTGSIEDFVQSIGRAGRDGKNSACVALYDFNKDYRTQIWLIDITNPTPDDIKGFWKWMQNYAFMKANGRNQESVMIEMTQANMQKLSKCKNVSACIGFLKKEGVMETASRGKYIVKFGKSKFDYTEITKQRKEKLNRLRELVSFYQFSDCRYRYICDYFDDNSLQGACGHCDNCDED